VRFVPVIATLALLVSPVRAVESPEEAAYAAFERARAESRRHLKSEDFALARAALMHVVNEHPGTEGARRAAAEISYVDDLAEEANADAFKRAASAAGYKNWAEALAGFTRLAARSDTGEWAEKARAEIKKITEATEAEYAKRAKEAAALVAEMAYDRAGNHMRRVARSLAGTGAGERAAGDAQDLADLAESFTALVARINASKDAPKKTPFKITDMTGWEAKRPIVRADEEQVWLSLGAIVVTRPWKGFSSDQFAGIAGLYEPMSEDRLALAVRWLWEGDAKRAREAIGKLMTDPVVGGRARALMNRFRKLENEAVYEFENGAEILDWRSRAGRWAIQDGALLQESVGEGRLELAARPHLSASGLRVAFEFVLQEKGTVTVELVQDAANLFGFSMSSGKGYFAYATVGGETKTVSGEKWRPKTGQRYVIRCGVKGGKVALSVGTLKMPRLEAKGVAAFEGTLVLRTSGAAVRFDRLRIANRRE